MTALSDAPRGGIRSAELPLFPTIALLTFGFVMGLAYTQIFDPLVRNDDFPTLLSRPELFWGKTLSEGRWINYLWIQRPWLTPAWFNFALYQLLWATLSAAMAINALGRDKPVWLILGLSLLLALSPYGFLISSWFNTTIPGLVLITLYAVLALYLTEQQTRLLLFVFVPLSLMAYTTFPHILLVICLTRFGSQRSGLDLIKLVGIFLTSFMLGMLLIYTLNWIFHGTFGVVMDGWREPSPVRDLASLLVNLETAAEFVQRVFFFMGMGVLPLIIVHSFMVFFGLALLYRIDKWLAAYIAVGIVIGMGMLLAHTVKEGALPPVRAVMFFWALHAITLGFLLDRLRRQARGYMLTGLSLFAGLVILHGLVNMARYGNFVTWQKSTATLATQIGRGSQPLYIYGDYKQFEGSREASIYNMIGLTFRLEMLTGREIIACTTNPERCDVLPVSVDKGYMLLKDEASIVLVLPTSELPEEK